VPVSHLNNINVLQVLLDPPFSAFFPVLACQLSTPPFFSLLSLREKRITPPSVCPNSPPHPFGRIAFSFHVFFPHVLYEAVCLQTLLFLSCPPTRSAMPHPPNRAFAILVSSSVQKLPQYLSFPPLFFGFFLFPDFDLTMIPRLWKLLLWCAQFISCCSDKSCFFPSLPCVFEAPS